MANLTEEEFNKTQITLSFTQEELEQCFSCSDEEKSEEEEFDAKAWRQGIRDAERDLEMKKYAYHKRLLLEDMRERRENCERVIREAYERKKEEELAILRKAQEEFEAKQQSLQLEIHIKQGIRNRRREKRQEEKRKREAEVLLTDQDEPPKKKVVINATDLTE